jgi:GT2 family glycosyltransferase
VAEPTVSVVIPTFRREATLREAVVSALAQEGVPLEVIVLDDSPEASARDAIAAIGDGRVRYVHRATPSGGVPALVRNEGLAMARGRYVHFLDDDDRLAGGALAALVAALEAAPRAGVAVGVVVPFGDDAAVLARQRAYFARAAARLRRGGGRIRLTATLLFEPTPLVNSACMIRRECAERVGGYAPAVARCEDVDFYMRAIRRCGHVFVDRPVVHYRTGAPSLMHSLAEDSSLLAESYRAIYRRYRREHGVLELALLRAVARFGRVAPAGDG